MQLKILIEMRIDIITVLPEMLEGFVNESILARAQKKGLAEIHLHNLRDYTQDKWKRVDDYPYGGKAGMVIQCQPLDTCISTLKKQRHYDEIIFTAPDGETFNQSIANDLSLKENIIIICGHAFQGYLLRNDEIREHADITVETALGLSAFHDALREAYGDKYYPDTKLTEDEIRSELGMDDSLYEEVYAENTAQKAHPDTFIAVKVKEGKTDEVKEKLAAKEFRIVVKVQTNIYSEYVTLTLSSYPQGVELS